MQEFLNGGDDALKKAYHQYRHNFTAWAKKHFPAVDAHVVEDVYHDALEIFYRNVLSGKLTALAAPVQNYLIGIGKNKLLQFVEKNKRVQTTDTFIDAPDQGVQNFLDAIVDREIDDDKKLKLRNAFGKLSEICQKLLIQRYYESRSVDEIALAMKYDNTNTASAAISRCLKNLKNLAN